MGADCDPADRRRRSTTPSCADFEAIALALGMAVLVEVHDERRARARAAPCARRCVGINNRNLRTFEVIARDDAGAAAARSRPGALVVTESGIRRAGRRRAACAPPACDAFLVGEAFMRAADPGVALASLLA